MICWFEQGVTDSYGDGLEPMTCLGILKGSACPHFDGVGALFVKGVATEFVSSRPTAKAYRYESETANEQVLNPTFLG